MKKNFAAQKFQDFEIYEDGEKYGELRVTPSSLKWKPKGEHNYYKISIESFSKFVQENGIKQKK
ncbi:MAG: hypothetical protein COA85_00180 [Robiginitomaculum sp.]|nr:MAG: hypothetical protein COA85_00180 [Robiginitomaculum sp.]